MGYYVEFNLVLKHDSEELSQEKIRKIIQNFKEASPDANDAFDDDGDCKELCKWLVYNSELKAFSNHYPEILFTLHCRGQEGDVWNCYYKNGDYQTASAEMNIEPYNPDKNSMFNEKCLFGKTNFAVWKDVAQKMIAINQLGISLSVEPEIANRVYISINTNFTDGIWDDLQAHHKKEIKEFEAVDDNNIIYKIEGDYLTAITKIEDWITQLNYPTLVEIFNMIINNIKGDKDAFDRRVYK